MRQINKYYQGFICSFSFVLLYSCGQGEYTSQNKVIANQLDTLQMWIKNGRDNNLSIGSRKKQLEKAYDAAKAIEEDSSKTKVFSRLSLAYWKLNDSSKFRETNNWTLRLAKKTNDSISLAEANWDLGEFFRFEAIADSAYYHYAEAQRLFQSLGKDFESATMLNNMAIVQADVKDYTGSEISSIGAIEIFKPLNDYRQLYNSYNNLGSITKELKEYDRAIEYYNIALEYQKKLPGENTLNLILKNNIGAVFQEHGRYEESIPYFREVLGNEFLFEKYPKLYALALNNLAYSESKVNPKKDLSEQFKKAIQIQDSIGDVIGKSRSHFGFAEYYWGKNDTTAALSQAKKALSYAEMANNNNRVLETLRLLTRIDPNNSSFYNQRYITLNDNLQEEERQIRDKFARIRFETDEYIAENEILESETRLWAGIAFAIFLLGASAFIMLDQRAKNQKLRFQQQQQASNQEIFNLMLAQKQKEEEGKKAEQKRISEELHDGVLGRMLGARMVLTGLNKKSDTEAELQRKKAIDALQDVEKEVRAISHELSHSAYRKMHNFMLSLQELLKTVEDTAHINCQLVFDDTKDWDALNGDIKINTYRMVQESLQNAVKHAHCEEVKVTFALKDETLQVTIADDGKGFRPKKGKRGIGMRNIASRVEKLNGQWHLESSPGEGTTVVLKIPVTDFTNDEAQNTKMKKLTQEA